MLNKIKENIGYQLENAEYLIERGVRATLYWAREKFPYFMENLDYIFKEQAKKAARAYLQEVQVWNPEYLMIAIRLDPTAFLGEVAEIDTPGGPGKFNLYPCQKRWFEFFRDDDKFALAKGRQVGFSSALMGYAYLSALLADGRKIVVYSYNFQASGYLHDKFRRIVKSADRNTKARGVKLHECHFSKREDSLLRKVTFENGSVVEFRSQNHEDELLHDMDAIYLLDESDFFSNFPQLVGKIMRRSPLQVVMGSTLIVKEKEYPEHNYSRFERISKLFEFHLDRASWFGNLGIPQVEEWIKKSSNVMSEEVKKSEMYANLRGD